MRIPTFDRPQMPAFDLSVPALSFGEDRTALGMPAIEYRLASADGGGTALPNGILAQPDGDLSLLSSADIAIIPSWNDMDDPIAPNVAAALQTVVANGG